MSLLRGCNDRVLPTLTTWPEAGRIAHWPAGVPKQTIVKEERRKRCLRAQLSLQSILSSQLIVVCSNAGLGVRARRRRRFLQAATSLMYSPIVLLSAAVRRLGTCAS
ncbi:hypothetical protein M011DRAFT_277136 [Sporormia fimetaria CBS 119925]|uniref:Uncharacterized protein n=1 Tax=Sporormia fimetaria CBS 119925 TaxID=1340428 RepID=A0A6A6VJT0_9PLEO|nr:hypothetical protein M011DRAFT_277136 [Sporormia fimetaria CBS 119925]